MKILWIVNMVLPALAKHLNITTSASGTWMEDLSDKISKTEGLKLAVACVYGTEYKKYEIGNITFYLLPGNGKTMLFYSPKLIPYWQQVENDWQPDIVHIHGTEYSHGLSYLRTFKDKKYLLTIQGIISKIAEKNDGGLSLKTKLKYRTLSENTHFNGMIESKLLMKFNARHEREIIRKVGFATGRTDWDKAFIKKINPDCAYFRVFYNLRDAFYGAQKWDVKTAEPHTVYASTSAGLPLKGGHVVLKALAQVKKVYPDVKAVFIAPAGSDKMLKVTNGYTKYINSLIDRYDLKDNLEFYNRLNTQEVIEVMRRVRCCVIPSAMENASATLREAMDLGVPSIASYRGGMVDLIENGRNGFFFDYDEPEYLAQKICQIFESDELCQTLSENAMEAASKWHDREKNVSDMVGAYKTIMGE